MDEQQEQLNPYQSKLACRIVLALFVALVFVVVLSRCDGVLGALGFETMSSVKANNAQLHASVDTLKDINEKIIQENKKLEATIHINEDVLANQVAKNKDVQASIKEVIVYRDKLIPVVTTSENAKEISRLQINAIHKAYKIAVGEQNEK